MARYIAAALEEAKKSPMSTKYGAVLVKNGSGDPISKGFNRYKCLPSGNHKENSYCVSPTKEYEPNKYSWHAEQKCIMDCKEKHSISKCTLFLVRITGNTNVIPCAMCSKIIKKYGVKNVLCYAYDEITETFLRINHHDNEHGCHINYKPYPTKKMNKYPKKCNYK